MNTTLHALIIGINEYRIKPLYGCVSDAEAMYDFLDKYCQKNAWTFNPTKLINSGASRQKIIEGYQSFANAKKGDTCFVFYSGHGWHFPAPAAFWVEANKENQALVCSDSLDNARVLVDKELAFLGWEATNDKEIHLIEIFDCCHAGGMTRDIAIDNTVETRFIPSSERALTGNFSTDTYYGYDRYIKQLDVQTQQVVRISVPMPTRMTLSASKGDETAKEKVIDGRRRGLFTYSLLETLQEFGEDLTYSELMDYVFFKTKNLVLPMKEIFGDQSPQYDTSDIEPNTVFLTGEEKPLLREYLMGYEDENKRWLLKAGNINGIPLEGTTIVKLKENGQSLAVKEVTVGYSVMDIPNTLTLDPKRIYKVQITKIARSPVPISVSNYHSKNIVEAYNLTYQDNNDVSFQLTDKPDALYILMANNQGSHILRNIDNRQITDNVNVEDIRALFADAETIGRWHQLLNLKNPKSNLTDAVKIEVSLFTKSDDYKQPIATFSNFGLDNPIQLAYEGNNNPHFSVQITNNSNKKLWLSALYMMDDYGITNALTPSRKEELFQGNKLLLSYDSRTLLEVNIGKELQAKGIKNITEYIKIIVSTEEFNTNSWNQNSLQSATLRALGSGESMNNDDPNSIWVTFDLALNIKL